MARMEYKYALKRGLYDFENARNWYRQVCEPDNGGEGMHHDLVFEYIRTNALLIAPFTPHYSEYIWQKLLGETTTVQTAPFPKPSGPVDPILIQRADYQKAVLDGFRSAEATMSKRKGKAKASGAVYDPSKPKSARVFVATEFPEWQNKCVELVQSCWDEASNTVDDAKLKGEMEKAGLIKDKRAMPFSQTFKVGYSHGQDQR